MAQSHGTFVSCKYFGDHNLNVINVSCIKSVVAMIPHIPPTRSPGIVDGSDAVDRSDKYYYLVERPGLDVTYLGGNSEVFEL